jgi:hypothetical protein
MKQEIVAITDIDEKVYFFAHSSRSAVYYAKKFVTNYKGKVKLYTLPNKHLIHIKEHS